MKSKFLILITILLIYIPSEHVLGDQTYVLQIDEHTYEIEFNLNGDMIAMAIDPELTSLLIGIENVRDGEFSIRVLNELISAQNNEFAILVDGFEIDYEIEIYNNEVLFLFDLYNGAQEIEIIGTNVIPEFPLGTVAILLTTIALVTTFTKMRIGPFR